MINASTVLASQPQQSDGWGFRRIWVAASCAVTFGIILRVDDFWSVGSGGLIGRLLYFLFILSQFFLVIFIVGYFIGLAVAAAVALWRGHFRRMASSIVAFAFIPMCFIAAVRSPVLDPWLWYAMANYTRFEALAANKTPSSEPRYAVVSGADVSIGLAGSTSDHFIRLIYDESDAVGLDPSARPSIWLTRNSTPEGGYTPIPKGRRVYGHLFRVDEFQ